MLEVLVFQYYLVFFLASITVLLCFFSSFSYFNNFFTIPVVKENIKLKLALAIPAGAPIVFAKEKIDAPPPIAD